MCYCNCIGRKVEIPDASKEIATNFGLILGRGPCAFKVPQATRTP